MSHQIVPEVEELLSRQEYDLESHTVSILELNIADLAEGSKWIGENKIAEEKEEQEDDKSDHCNDDDDDDEIVGMSLQEKSKNQVQQTSKCKSKSDGREIISSKELKQEVKKAALKRIKNSKAFQQKQRLEQQKNKKQSRQKLHKAQKLAHKHGKRSKKKSGR